MDADEVEFNDEYRRTWEYLIRNQHATASEVALNCDVSVEYAQGQIDRIGTPPEHRTSSTEPERVRLLKRGIELTAGDRNKTYGDPWSNLTDCAMLWEAYLQAKSNTAIELTAEDVAHMMALVKMTRSFRGNYHDDNYLDAAVYMAIAGECRKQEEST